MRHFLTILLATFSLSAKCQIKTGNYSVLNDSSTAVYLELSDSSKFSYYDCRLSSTYSWGMAYGHWTVNNDTLILQHEHLQKSAKDDTTYIPVRYTLYDGTIFTVTNATIVIELKKYLIRDSSLFFIKDDDNNEPSTWGNFNFTLKK
jgi:hypothetical protein